MGFRAVVRTALNVKDNKWLYFISFFVSSKSCIACVSMFAWFLMLSFYLIILCVFVLAAYIHIVICILLYVFKHIISWIICQRYYFIYTFCYMFFCIISLCYIENYCHLCHVTFPSVKCFPFTYNLYFVTILYIV